MNLSATLEDFFLQWRKAKAKYDDLAVGRKRDKDWWNDIDPRKTVAAWFKRLNQLKRAISIAKHPWKSLKSPHEADSPTAPAQRGSF